ncbi:ATP-binding protein [Lacrimispora sp. NSJ-141]|uniref:ATP-binding protein n=1 Tax=Lientehia hominis TaxID=2897778 RepID=A0AAP2RGT0_9FIRM|nr:ATP-binding protein [Lientehia hominis]MCD2491707.1 ATP-binding protein [Lientehia hominis]
MKINNLILYREPGHKELLEGMAALMEGSRVPDPYRTAGTLVEFSASHGFKGNLWHSFLAYILATNENAFSTACEIRGKVKGTINSLARHDFVIFKEWFDYDLERLDEKTGCPVFGLLKDYESTGTHSKIFNRRIRDNIQSLSVALAEAESPEAWLDIVTEFYRHFGVGKFGLHKAFRVEREQEKTHIVPIKNIEHVYLDDLVGYELQKKKLIENTEAFVEGREANNCLLFGDSGTGKSSSIKAILHQYYDQGLRMIEIYKHQFRDLSSVIGQIKNRNYKFIIYMDDLSFEEFEIEYKYLKAIIEGGLEVKPGNVLIYATSNRRHLIREKFSDKEEVREDMHRSDTVQEKLSLVARFGVTIYYGRPEPKEFQTIVKTLAERNGICMPEEELLAEANKWELSHGGISGRTAAQFITYLMGKRK